MGKQRQFETQMQQHVSDLVRKEVSEYGSYLKLEHEIIQANNEQVGYYIDRRKLKQIADGDDVKMSFVELQALDVYFNSRGLQRVLNTPTILASVAGLRNVVFFLGAKHKVDMSRWDVVAMATLQRAIYRLSRRVKFDIQDVQLFDESEELNEGKRAEQLNYLMNEPWFEAAYNQSTTALISIGSPKACHATEVMLARMFDIEPFGKSNQAESSGPPFRFVWGNMIGCQSSFATIEPRENTGTPEEYNAIGIDVGAKRIACSVDGDDRLQYGIIAAQYRKPMQLWLVVAGLTGGATEACSRFLETFIGSVPPLSGDRRHSDVLWAVVEAHISKVTSAHPLSGSDRRIAECRLYGDPKVYESKS